MAEAQKTAMLRIIVSRISSRSDVGLDNKRAAVIEKEWRPTEV